MKYQLETWGEYSEQIADYTSKGLVEVMENQPEIPLWKWVDPYTYRSVLTLPSGLVDVIFAGHTHQAIAHEVDGVAIAQAYSWGRAFSRVDVTVHPGATHDRSGAVRVSGRKIFPPREVCARETGDGRCATGETAGRQASYEGRPVIADAAVVAAMAPGLARVRNLQATRLGPLLETPLTRGSGTEESALANLFADAIRDIVPGTDAAIGQASGPGGLRVDLPPGPVTLGALYDTSATPPPAPVQQADRSEARAPQPWIAPQRPEPLDAELLDLLAETIAEKKYRRAIFP